MWSPTACHSKANKQSKSVERKVYDPHDDFKMASLMSLAQEKEKRYAMYYNVETLAHRLALTEMLYEEYTDPDKTMKLWYFVGDETEAKYLSNKKPEMHFDGESKVSEHGVVTDLPNIVWLTDGEINIRVPKCMEKMFPEIKYGDGPIEVKLGAWEI